VGTNKIDPELIRELVGQGLSNTEIANRFGWTVGTLYVRCSQLKISLRRSCKVRLRRWLHVPVSDDLYGQLRQRAAIMGVSTAELVMDLLNVIDRDGLYDAVLDRDDLEANRAVVKRAA
jgi:hypothetical protein